MKKHGEKAMEALHEEFMQTHDVNTFSPACTSRLSTNDEKKRYNCYPTQKRKEMGELKVEIVQMKENRGHGKIRTIHLHLPFTLTMC